MKKDVPFIVINLQFYEGMFHGCMEIMLEICALDWKKIYF